MTKDQFSVSLDDVVVNAELDRRPSRPPNYREEREAFMALAHTMAEAPHLMLQRLVETTLRLCRADTTGISLLETHQGEEVFRWEALAGVYADRLNNTMPRNASPCGTTIDRNATQLMYMAERLFPALTAVPPVVEALLVPFQVEGKPIGTVWVVAHDERRKFDREDERLIKTFTPFASAGWRLWKAQRESEQRFRLMVEGVKDYAIIMLDPEGRVTSWNEGAERIKGYRAEEILGQHFSRFYPPEEMANGTPEDLLAVAAATGRVEQEGWRVRKDGTRFWADVVITAIRDYAGALLGFSKVTRDLSERKHAQEILHQAHEALEQRVQERTVALANANVALQAEVAERMHVEAQLQVSLREKEVLLREVHHRVKNNLQVISSLLHLQAGFIDDPRVHAMFADCEHRIHSMALVHQSLYQSEHLADVDFGAYLHTLGAELLRSYTMESGRIELTTAAESLFLPVDTAILCGLLVNELIANGFEHAFPEGRAGHIWVMLHRTDDDQVQLCVRDDGIGLPAAVDHHTADSFGLQLISILSEQLNATLKIDRHAGTGVCLTFTHHAPRGPA